MSERVVTHVRIHGRVQGVWYRGWTVEEATRRGLDGWVRNRRDGTVEAIFAGPREAVDAMVDSCRRGPPSAQVEFVHSEPAAETVAAGFTQRPTV